MGPPGPEDAPLFLLPQDKANSTVAAQRKIFTFVFISRSLVFRLFIEIVTERLLKAGLGNDEIVDCLGLGKEGLRQCELGIVEFRNGTPAEVVGLGRDVVCLARRLDSGSRGIEILHGSLHLVQVLADGHTELALGILRLEQQLLVLVARLFHGIAAPSSGEDG